MPTATNASTMNDRPQAAGMQLPAGIRHVGELMPLVLAGYGVSLEGDGDDDVVSLVPWIAKQSVVTRASRCSDAVMCF
ncbi:MAG: hypothetical protein WD468_08035 [Pirellulales bacterium]